jgi:hypothetical protein
MKGQIVMHFVLQKKEIELKQCLFLTKPTTWTMVIYANFK